jgi:hypothetical protein
MDAAFWVKLALSFLVGSGWIALTTATAERRGSTLGGLIGGLPSTILVSLLFIGLTQTPKIAAETTTLMPLTQGVNGVFVVAFMLLARRGLVGALAGALAVWILLAGSVAGLAAHRLGVSVAGWLLLAVACHVAADRWMHIPSQAHVSFRCTRSQLILRALFGGSIISSAVLASKLLSPVYAGILATFPATFFSTLAITYRSGGAEFARAVGKALMTSGMVNAALYPLAVRFLYPSCGLALGTALALGFSCLTASVTYRVMRRFPSVPAPC